MDPAEKVGQVDQTLTSLVKVGTSLGPGGSS